MRASLELAFARLRRSPGQAAIRVAVLALATALLGAMLLFVGSSLRTMTGGAVRAVPLDWQGPVGSLAQARQAAAGAGGEPGVREAKPVATAPLARATHSGPSGSTAAGKGAVLAVPPGYLTHIATFRILHGGLRAGGIVLDQQLAATLQARVGDRVKLVAAAGSKPRAFTVTGVALVTAPDVLFQPLNPQIGPAPAQPPANVAIMPLGTFARSYAPALRAITPATVGSNAVPGSQTGVQWQVQAQVNPAMLRGSPGHALKLADRTRNRVERTLPGQVQFVDNLSEALSTAAGDALYAEALYIMLAVPGALIALGLAYLAALGTVERDRRDLALLRARGATRRDIVVLAVAESAILGLVAGTIGCALAVVAGATVIRGGVGLAVGTVAGTAVVCVLMATAGALAARLGASAGVLNTSISESRRRTRREQPALWKRLYLDWGALAISGLIYWLTARTGFSAVVNPDSNPTLSLSIYMFFAPALLWIGATLLLVRLRGRGLEWLTRRGASDRAERLPGFLLASASRRGAAINRGLVVVGLLLAFGVNLGIFSATYDQQARVDAELTLGADVVATSPPGVASRRNLAARVARVSGVRASTGVDHSYAYVGPDLQDTYGIDARSFTAATTLRDSYFLGAGAKETMQRLATTRDGILVSKETTTDYSLKPGDLLKLRLVDRRTGGFRVVPFHVAGVVQEFPSAPKDSFMVANLRYLEAEDHGQGPNVIFAKVRGNPTAVAGRVARTTKREGTVVKNIDDQTQQTVSSITTVNLSGISRIEEMFAIVLAAAAMGLFVALGITERRQEFATMAALGAPLREIGAFLWSEVALVLGTAVVLGAGLGLMLSKMLVAMLAHAFDPPPDRLAIPAVFLVLLGGAAVAATLAATALAGRRLRRLPLGEILREQ